MIFPEPEEKLSSSNSIFRQCKASNLILYADISGPPAFGLSLCSKFVHQNELCTTNHRWHSERSRGISVFPLEKLIMNIHEIRRYFYYGFVVLTSFILFIGW